MPCASSCKAAHRPVVAQMNHLHPGRLQDAPHDVDRRIMAIKQRCRGNEAYLPQWLIRRYDVLGWVVRHIDFQCSIDKSNRIGSRPGKPQKA